MQEARISMKAWFRKDGAGSRRAKDGASITRNCYTAQMLFSGDSRSQI
jgi:hypothetical protein